MVTSMNHDTKNEQAGIKRFNAQITDIMESVITKVETCEKELQHQQQDLIKIFSILQPDFHRSPISKPGTKMTHYTDTLNNSSFANRPMTSASNVIPFKNQQKLSTHAGEGPREHESTMSNQTLPRATHSEMKESINVLQQYQNSLAVNGSFDHYDAGYGQTQP